MKIAALSGKAAYVRRSGFFQCFRSPIWVAFVRCSTNFRPPILIPIPPLLTLALCFFDFIEFCFYSWWLFPFPLSPEKPVFYDGVQLFFTNPFPFPLAHCYSNPNTQQQPDDSSQLCSCAQIATFIPAAIGWHFHRAENFQTSPIPTNPTANIHAEGKAR